MQISTWEAQTAGLLLSNVTEISYLEVRKIEALLNYVSRECC